MRSLLLAHDRLTQAAFTVACGALVVLLGSYLVEIVARYGFASPTRWSSDMVQYMLCVCMSLALPTVTRDNGHVAITSFIEKLEPARRAQVLRVIVWLGALVLGGTSMLFLHTAVEQARQGVETVAAFAIPKWWLTAVVTFGLVDAALHLLRTALLGPTLPEPAQPSLDTVR